GIASDDLHHARPLGLREGALEALDVEHLAAGDPQLRIRLARLELQRQYAHADEVRAMDALEALDDDRPDTQEQRTLGCRVARLLPRSGSRRRSPTASLRLADATGRRTRAPGSAGCAA